MKQMHTDGQRQLADGRQIVIFPEGTRRAPGAEPAYKFGVVFLYDEFEVVVTTPTISRALASAGWSRKAACRVAKERNADLRDFYLHNLSEFR